MTEQPTPRANASQPLTTDPADAVVKGEDDLVGRLRTYAIGLSQVAADKLESQDARIRALTEEVERLRANAQCGCGYDDPAHVCEFHRPIVERATKAEAEVARLKEASIDFVNQVQTKLLTQDAILIDFDLDRLERLLEFLAPREALQPKEA